MGKTLSIVIPYYKETEKQISPLLSSINNQLGVEFSEIDVIMVNDGANNQLSKKFLSNFPNLKISCIMLDENVGPGMARSAGLNKSTSKYVMFCDADDTLHSVGVLGLFFEEFKNDTVFISSNWLEEFYIDNKFQYLEHYNDLTWFHGKAFRRDFLISNGIDFHPELRVHEDSYLMSILAELTQSMVHIPITSYVWKYGSESITRKNNSEYTYTELPTFIKSISYSYDWLDSKGYTKSMPDRVMQVICYIYFLTHTSVWMQPQLESYRQLAEDALVTYMKKFMNYANELTDDKKIQIYCQERDRTFKGQIENELFNDWIKRIGLI